MVSRRTFLTVLAALGVSCRGQKPGSDRPLTILFGPNHAPAKAEALRAAWEKASGLKLSFLVAKSGSEAVEIVLANRADAGVVSLFDHLYCAEVHGTKPLLTLVRNGGRVTQGGELVVRKDSSIAGVKDLAKRRVAFVDAWSTTGFLLAAAHLKREGVVAEPVWSGSHDGVLLAVKNGTAVAGATYAGHAATEPDLKVLASTGSVANEPFFVQSSLPDDARAALKRALLAPAELDGVADATGFREIEGNAYTDALATVKAAGKQAEDLVPGGWVRANEARRPLWSYDP